MKNGNHIIKFEQYSVIDSIFTEDYAFGYGGAKLEYWKRPPILILEKTPFAYLGYGFADFIKYRFLWRR